MKYLLLPLIFCGCSNYTPSHYIPRCHNVIDVSSSTPKEMWEPIQKAADIWNKHLHRNDLIKLRFMSNYGDMTIDVVYNDWKFDPMDEGLNTLHVENMFIYESHIHLNAVNFRLDSSGVDVESLVLHEMGHMLGYMHKNDGGVMSPELAERAIRLDPLPDGKDFVCW